MKYLKYIVMSFILVAGLASCETEVDRAMISPSEGFIAPVLDPMGDIIVDADNNATESVTFVCSKPADFGLNVAVEYMLYLKKDDVETLLSASNSLSFTVAKSDINGKVVNDLNVPASQTAEISAYLVARIESDTEIYTKASNVINFNVTTYKAEIRSVFATGEFAGWLGTADNAIEIFETGGGTNVYECIVNLTDAEDDDTNADFKITSHRDWAHGNWGYSAFTGGLSSNIMDNGDNLCVTPGIYRVTVDLTVMSIIAEPISSVTILGDFGGWDAGEVDLIYSYTDNAWTSSPITFSDGLGFLARLDKNWDKKLGDSGTRDMDIPDGIVLTLGGGDNITVPTAGTYIIKLHADRTPNVLEIIQ